MQDIVCPQCEIAFKVNEAVYADIVKQDTARNPGLLGQRLCQVRVAQQQCQKNRGTHPAHG
jgi:hypothetical protein